MSATKIHHLSVEERQAEGEESRERMPPSTHGEWAPGADRFDPIALIEQQNETREPDLVPVRHGRMMVSPFTFYRGAAKIMAADLEHTPRAGLTVQLCGDAHLSNFGAFASPERQLLFDLNDFDETLPARSSTTSSVSLRASPSRRATTASAEPTRATRRSRPCAAIERRWPSSRRCPPWTSGMRTCPRRR